MPTPEERLDAIEAILIRQGLMEAPERDTEVYVPTHRTPEQMRGAGVAYCPECYTFGDTHRRDCKYKDKGMRYHVTRLKG